MNGGGEHRIAVVVVREVSARLNYIVFNGGVETVLVYIVVLRATIVEEHR